MTDQLTVVNEPPTLSIINQNGQLLVDSRDVAGMVGKEHKNLLRDIKGYTEILDGSKLSTPNFFISSTYRNSQNKEQPCYLLTRKGCDMVANKLTGEKGVLFTATYVTRFEEMENQLRKQINIPNDPFGQIELLAAGTSNLNKRVSSLEQVVEEQLTIDYGQQRVMEKAKAKRIYFLWENGHVNTEVHDSTRKLFGLLGRNLKDAFDVNSYRDILKKDFNEALNFINGWRPMI
ncbi:phage regulatory protein, rha family [Bacillus sp. 491mf]|uniref:Rha family transcriptional regulator n=1 Tax=Bacillus sp. 491mf TaxID=1761755 RepID=UPI0008EE8E8F|nr:Rha family transcriptional regulator [Bacillus sp. 491mf]SFC01743.1 phage regulatory protein, rha family [Bacillus sp. 491mf]